jgi:hypothetical protein
VRETDRPTETLPPNQFAFPRSSNAARRGWLEPTATVCVTPYLYSLHIVVRLLTILVDQQRRKCGKKDYWERLLENSDRLSASL